MNRTNREKNTFYIYIKDDNKSSYYYSMKTLRLLFVLVGLFVANICSAQFIETERLMNSSSSLSSGRLHIDQNAAIDSLISRSILSNMKNGMSGVRIQIYYSSVRNAREESAKVRADFINKFPDIVSYVEYQEPGWFRVRVGNYHSKVEAYKDLLMIRRSFPDAYLIYTNIESPYSIK